MQAISLNKICQLIGINNPFSDRQIEYICRNINLIKNNSLYVTIAVESFNGYIFDKQKIINTNSIILTTKQIDEFPCIIVDNPALAMFRIAEYCRQQYSDMKTITVSGSIGKTTAKEMLYSVLNENKKTARSYLTCNNTLELCRLIFSIDNSYKFTIMELGLRGPTKPFVSASRILRPDAALITNIGHSHIENFKNKEEILEHKLSMTEYMKPDGVLFLNGDDELLFNTKYKFKTVFFGIKNKNCDYLAVNIEKSNEYSKFTIISKDNKTHIDVKLNAPGGHNILNALSACAIGKYFGVTDEEIIRGLENFKTSGFRNNLVKGTNGNIILADCFNATPESMLSAFETFKDIKVSGKKIAVLGHMMRLGTRSEELHRKTGKDVCKYNFDTVLTYGYDAYFIHEEVLKCSPNTKTKHFYTKSDLITYLKNNVSKDDGILFKGVEKFNDFQDLYNGFNNPNYISPIENYIGMFADDINFHSEAQSMYFANDDDTYIAKNIHDRVYVKDISFILPIICIIEKSNLEDIVTISDYAASKYVADTGIKFNPTNKFKVKDLLNAALLKSSYEALYALIEHAFGNFETYKKYADNKLNEIGTLDTSFEEFSPAEQKNNYTTAYDMFLIIKYALKNNNFYDIANTSHYTLKNLKSGKETPIVTCNKLQIHEPKVTYIDYYADKINGIKAERVYQDTHLIKNVSLAAFKQKQSGNDIVGILLNSDDFLYCRNSYMDMKRILNFCD